MKKIAASFFVALLASISFSAHAALVLTDINEIVPTDKIVQEMDKNRVPLIIIGGLTVLLILFILLYLSARDKAIDRKAELKVKNEEIANLKGENLKQKEIIAVANADKSRINSDLQQEKAKYASVDAQLKDFQKMADDMNLRIETLHRKVVTELSTSGDE